MKRKPKAAPPIAVDRREIRLVRLCATLEIDRFAAAIILDMLEELERMRAELERFSSRP